MALIHAKVTVVKVDSDDLSTYTTSSEFEQTADSHDVTTYGSNGHKFAPGLTNGKFTMEGLYDSTASTGPRAVLQPLIGADVVTVVRQAEGTGTGKPQDSFSGQCTSYKETNPAADMVKWSAEFQISGTVDNTAQA